MTKRKVAGALALLLLLSACATRATLPPPEEPLFATAHADFPDAPKVPSLMRAIRVPSIQVFRLKNGLHVYVVERLETSDIALAYVARAGGEDGPLAQRGLSTLALRALMHAEGDADGERAGKDPLHWRTNDDGSFLATTAPPEALETVLQDLVSTISTSELTFEAIETAVAKQLDGLHWSVYDQGGLARQHALRMLLGDQHPLGYPTYGMHDNLEKITVGDVMKRRRAMLAPETSALVLVGAVARERAEQLAIQHLGRLARANEPEVAPPTPLRGEGDKRVRALLTPGGVARIVQAFRAPTREHPDFTAFSLLSILTGELASSRLFTALREQQEQTYSIGSSYLVRRSVSTFVVETDVQSDGVGETLSGIDRELDKLRTSQVTARELSRAKLVARERIAAQLERNDDVRALLTGMIVTGRELPPDPQRTLSEHIARIDATTPEEVLQVANTYLGSVERGVAVSGPLTEFLPALSDWAGESQIDMFVPKRIADVNHLSRTH